MKHLYLFLALILVVGCKKDKPNPILKGTYTGVFIVNVGSSKITFPTEIIFNQNRFQIKGYKSYNGTFDIRNNTDVEFKDENNWTADFNWALLLSGKYKYEIKGDELILTKYVVGKDPVDNQYQYKLKRLANAG